MSDIDGGLFFDDGGGVDGDYGETSSSDDFPSFDASAGGDSDSGFSGDDAGVDGYEPAEIGSDASAPEPATSEPEPAAPEPDSVAAPAPPESAEGAAPSTDGAATAISPDSTALESAGDNVLADQPASASVAFIDHDLTTPEALAASPPDDDESADPGLALPSMVEGPTSVTDAIPEPEPPLTFPSLGSTPTPSAEVDANETHSIVVAPPQEVAFSEDTEEPITADVGVTEIDFSDALEGPIVGGGGHPGDGEYDFSLPQDVTFSEDAEPITPDAGVTELNFSDALEDPIVIGSGQPGDADYELSRVRDAIAEAKATVATAEHEAIESALKAFPTPVINSIAAATYDAATGDGRGATQQLLEGGVEQTAEDLAERLGGEAVGAAADYVLILPKSAEMTRSWQEYGDEVMKMTDLRWQEYELMVRLGDPNARFDIGYNGYYMGAAHELFDSNGAPVKRIQEP
jgi:hypothetical protein